MIILGVICMENKLTKLSKRLSFVLRHHPEKIGIQLDQYGRVDLDELIQKFNEHYGNQINKSFIDQIIKQSDKQRYAIEGNTIRALYGHSMPVDPLAKPTMPPTHLFHGTSHAAASFIENEGLSKMERKFVHLSEDRKSAMQVGQRRDSDPVILQISALDAAQDDFVFYPTKSGIWLVDEIPAKYIHRT